MKNLNLASGHVLRTGLRKDDRSHGSGGASSQRGFAYGIGSTNNAEMERTLQWKCDLRGITQCWKLR